MRPIPRPEARRRFGWRDEVVGQILNTDIDGLLSGSLLHDQKGWPLWGFYDTVNLWLTTGATTVDTSLLSIVDNDNLKASVQLSSPVYDLNEADGTATVTVTLSHAVDADVTVHYATADGSAVAGYDYTDTNGTLTFTGNLNNGGPGTGETSKTIQIPITQAREVPDRPVAALRPRPHLDPADRRPQLPAGGLR